MKTKRKIKQDTVSDIVNSFHDDPIKSHDGMDIDSRSGVVETTGYGYKLEVAEDVIEAFEQDLEDDRESLADRLNNCPTISREDQTEPDFEYVR